MSYIGIDAKKDIRLNATSDLDLTSDSTTIKFGADDDVILTHVHNTGLTLNSTNKIMFNDASQFIQGSSATVLSLGATDEIDLTATTIDINGALDVSGTVTASTGGSASPSFTFSGDTNTGMFKAANDTIGFTTGGTERVQIGSFGVAADQLTNKTASGGITIDAAGDITLDADGGDVIFKDGGSEKGRFTNNSGTFTIDANTNLTFRGGVQTFDNADGSTEYMRITSSGNVGIGTASPSSTLEVSKSDQTNGATLTITNAFSGGSWAVNDVIGTIDFKSDDASSSQLVRGKIQSVTDDVSGTNWSYGTALTFSTAFNNSLSEAMRIDSSGNVGIGTDNPGAKLDVLSDSSNTNPDTDLGVYHRFLNSNTGVNTGSAITLGSNSNSGAAIYAQRVGSNNEHKMGFQTRNSSGASATRMTLDGSGNVTISDGDLVIGTSGHGIDFSASGGPQGTGTELLDDYEVGEWTPNPYGGTTAGTYTNYARAGRYIKTGRMVYASGYIYGVISGAAGEARVGGLPFQKDSNDTGLATVQWNNCPFNTIASDEHHPVGLVYTDYLFVRASDRVAQGAYHTCVWNNSTISYYRFSATYRAA